MKDHRTRSALATLALSAIAVAGAPEKARGQSVPDRPFYPPYEQVVDILDGFPSHITAVQDIEEPWASATGPLKALIISDNPTEIEDEPVILLTGVIHGREPMGLRAVLGLADELVSNYDRDPAIRRIVDSYHIVIVPVMNRWGYENRGRKNAPGTDDPLRTGVDLNRNGAFGWDRCDNFRNADKNGNGTPDCHEPLEGTFHGPGPDSEYETQAMQALVDRLKPVFGVVFHSGTGDTRGQVFYPYSTRDHGDDGVDGNADDIVLTRPADVSVGVRLAIDMRRAVHASRQGGRFCADPASLPRACQWPGTGWVGSAGGTSANYYALTGMFELLVETHAYSYTDEDGRERYNAWIQNYLYQDRQTLRADRQAIMDDAEEYARSYADGLRGLLESNLCQGAPSAAALRGPGFTGRVLDAGGRPLPATIKVAGLDDTLHGDFIDADPSTTVFDRTPYGGEDFRYRTAQRDTGRFYRLLADRANLLASPYEIEISADGMTSQTRSIDAFDPDGCLNDLGDIVLEPVATSSGICTIAPEMTGRQPGSVLPRTDATFEWTSNGCHYWIRAGDAPGRNNYHDLSLAGATHATVSGYPADGGDVHITLLHRDTNVIGAPWVPASFVYRAPQSTVCRIPPRVTSHDRQATLASGADTFSWTSNGCHYWVYVGSAPDRNDYHNESVAGATSVSVSGYPADGSEVHLTLLYRDTNIIGAPWQREYFVFRAPG